MSTVHCAVHRFLHPNLTVTFQNQKEMHSDKSRRSDGAWLGIGLEANRKANYLARVPSHILYSLAENGEDVKTVRSLMRHANSSITMNIYTHAVTSKKR